MTNRRRKLKVWEEESRNQKKKRTTKKYKRKYVENIYCKVRKGRNDIKSLKSKLEEYVERRNIILGRERK